MPRPDLPEPADLHAQLSRDYRLDWGEPIPTAMQIAGEFGTDATAESLELVHRMIVHHGDATRDVIDSIRPGDTTYELEHRIKSPASLARKIWKYRSLKAMPPLDDVLRFTVVAKQPERLVESVRQTVDQLRTKGWSVESAHQSYVEGTRYKGIHAIMRTTSGARAELQFHSPESIRVKTQTTNLYHTERDPRQSRTARDAASAEAVQLSALMEQPAGIEDLTQLGGVPVEPRRYGSPSRQGKHQAPMESQPSARDTKGPARQRDVEDDRRAR